MSFTVYPNAIDGSDQLPVITDNVTAVMAEVINRHRDAILAIEAQLGVLPAGTFSTVRARLDAMMTGGSGGGGGGQITVQDESITLLSDARILNFLGLGITAIVGDVPTKRIDISVAGGAATQVQETLPVTSPGQTAFTLSQTPAQSNSVELFINGIKAAYGSDYLCVGTAVTYVGIPLIIYACSNFNSKFLKHQPSR